MENVQHERGLAELLAPEISQMLQSGQSDDAAAALGELMDPELADVMALLEEPQRSRLAELLPLKRAADVLALLDPEPRDELLDDLDNQKLAEIFNEMSPDDRADLFSRMPASLSAKVLALMRPEERRITQITMGFPEESVGRAMTTDYLAIRADWTAARAMDHIRRNGREAETIDTLYVVDRRGRLEDDIRIRQLILADPDRVVDTMMDRKAVTLRAGDDREEAVRVMERYDRPVLPVTDDAGVLLGIVTFDDVADIAEQEATEDMHKMGAVAALDQPYLSVSLVGLFRKRGAWLAVLFLGQMLTAAAMGHFSGEIEQAIILAIFVPLIISSGGNSGSQAATLVIRAMATGEVRMRDWLRVFRRELVCGLMLGALLGGIGLLRIHVWQWVGWDDYTVHYHLVGLTLGIAVVAVVVWGTLTGSMLPFLLRTLRLDPATASAPFIATLVDVTGIVIYFAVAIVVLRGTLL